eukprot:5400113-Pyramimonas_sp.AAC.1
MQAWRVHLGIALAAVTLPSRTARNRQIGRPRRQNQLHFSSHDGHRIDNDTPTRPPSLRESEDEAKGPKRAEHVPKNSMHGRR